MLKSTFAAAAVVLPTLFLIPGPATAAEQQGGLHNSDSIEVSAARKHKKRTAQRSAASHAQDLNDRPWVGHDTDFAGNSFVYYRVGVGSPFGPILGSRRYY